MHLTSESWMAQYFNLGGSVRSFPEFILCLLFGFADYFNSAHLDVVFKWVLNIRY